MQKLLQLMLLCLVFSQSAAESVHRRHSPNHNHQHVSNANELSAERSLFDDYDDRSSAHVVISKEGPPPAPQEYTISKLEEPVVCDAKGDKTWAKWKKYDLDSICSRLQYYGEIEGQCETDCDQFCPNGFYEVAKEPCTNLHSGLNGLSKVTHVEVHTPNTVHTHTFVNKEESGGYYRQCVGRYQCTHSQYNYWVNMKWWQFLLWEVFIVIIGCCFCGLMVGCCLRCTHSGGAIQRNNSSFRPWYNGAVQRNRNGNNNGNNGNNANRRGRGANAQQLVVRNGRNGNIGSSPSPRASPAPQRSQRNDQNQRNQRNINMQPQGSQRAQVNQVPPQNSPQPRAGGNLQRNAGGGGHNAQ